MTESTTSVKTTGEQYEKQYFPLGGFLFIKKDIVPEQVGSIIIAKTIQEDHSKYTTTGVIVSKSMNKTFEDEYDRYIWSILRRGDRVGFGTTMPLFSPSPPYWEFKEEEKDRYITLHARDVLCVICDSEEKKISFVERFE